MGSIKFLQTLEGYLQTAKRAGNLERGNPSFEKQILRCAQHDSKDNHLERKARVCCSFWQGLPCQKPFNTLREHPARLKTSR